MKRDFIKNNYEELLELLNCLKVGVYITDAKGETLMLNEESCKTGSWTKEEIVGKTMYALKDEGYIENSVTIKTLNSKKEESIIQNLGDGGKLFVTGVPYFDTGKVELVVCTERDITETLSLKKLIEEQGEETEKYKKEIEYLRKQNIEMWGDLIAEEDFTKLVVDKALRVAKTDATVLLTGETGTGKEVFANFIYSNSSRDGKPFIKVNCAAIPETLLESEMFGYVGGAFTGAEKKGKMGLFEMANGGTIFLDEIAEIPIHLQPKLLRVLQEKEIMRIGGKDVLALDIRIIAATNKDLQESIERGSFRQDLYYRLNIMQIELPPLRERRKDIPALTKFFLDRFNIEYRMNKYISNGAMDLLYSYQWPGNIRELENIIERLMISFDSTLITKSQLEAVIGNGNLKGSADINHSRKTFAEMVEDYEKELLQQMVDIYVKPAEITRKLKINKSTLSRKMKKYEISQD